jgi:xanthine dehydrogenase iron-sulfur cluster and FAD-binding subunit A
MGSVHQVVITVNGTPRVAAAAGRTHLADLLRDTLGLTGTRLGCEHGVCGCCTAAVSTRAVSAAQFYQGYLTTALAPEELLTEIRFPAAAAHTGAAFAEVARRRGDFALVGCAAQVTLAGGLIADARICLSGVAGVPVRGAAAEDLLRRRPLDDALLARAAADVAAGLSPPTDLHGSGEYRRHLAAVLIRRTVIQAHQRARDQRAREQRAREQCARE